MAIRKPLSRIGFWSGILSAAFTIWFSIAFFTWNVVAPPIDWQAIHTYAASFQSTPFVTKQIPREIKR